MFQGLRLFKGLRLFQGVEYSRKQGNYNGTINFEIDIMKKSSPINGVLARTTDTQWRHKSKISEKLGRCGRQNMLRPYLKIWDWDWIFGRAVKAISSLGVRSPWICLYQLWCSLRSAFSSPPTTKFLGTAEAYFVCHIGPIFQGSLPYCAYCKICTKRS